LGDRGTQEKETKKGKGRGEQIRRGGRAEEGPHREFKSGRSEDESLLQKGASFMSNYSKEGGELRKKRTQCSN